MGEPAHRVKKSNIYTKTFRDFSDMIRNED